MGRIYKKVKLENLRDLKKGTRSIIASCKDLSRGRKVKRILMKLNKENIPMISNTLVHNELTLFESIKNIDNNSNVVILRAFFKNLQELIEYSYTHPRDGYFKTIPKKNIATMLKTHAKIFKYLNDHKQAKNEVIAKINNDEWRKTYLTAINIWGNNSYR